MRTHKLSIYMILFFLILYSNTYGQEHGREFIRDENSGPQGFYKKPNIEKRLPEPSSTAWRPIPSEVVSKIDLMIVKLTSAIEMRESNKSYSYASPSENSTTIEYEDQLHYLSAEQEILRGLEEIFDLFGNGIFAGVSSYIAASASKLPPGPQAILASVLYVISERGSKIVKERISSRLTEIDKIYADVSNLLYNERLRIAYELNQMGMPPSESFKPVVCKHERRCRPTTVCWIELGIRRCSSEHTCFFTNTDCS